jgi:hypothetical protein
MDMIIVTLVALGFLIKIESQKPAAKPKMKTLVNPKKKHEAEAFMLYYNRTMEVHGHTQAKS